MSSITTTDTVTVPRRSSRPTPSIMRRPNQQRLISTGLQLKEASILMFAVTVVVVGHSPPEVRLLKCVSVYSSSPNESLRASCMIWQTLRCSQESRSTNRSNTRGLHSHLRPHNSLCRTRPVNIPHSTQPREPVIVSRKTSQLC